MRCLLVDKITDWAAGQHIRGVKNVTMSENFLQDHFPGFPVMPGVLQLEAVSQLGSWLVFATTGFIKKARLASVGAVKFKEFIVPGDQMDMQLTITALDEERARANAKIFVSGTLKTDIRNACLTFVDAAALEDPAGARKHFDFICGNLPMGTYSNSGQAGQ